MTDLLLKIFAKGIDPASTAYRTRIGFLASTVCIACNIVLCAAKAAVGVLAGSVSIVADAVNNLSDASSNIVSLLGFRLASRPADEGHPYGHGRYEYLAGLAVAVIVSALGLDLVKESVGKIFSPEPSEFSAALVAVLLGSMAVKFWMMLFNRSLGRRIDSPVLIAAGQDSRNDVITTSVVVLGMVAGRFTPLPVDGYVGILVAAFIIWSGIGIARDTVAPLLGEAADPVMAKNIEHIVLDSEHIVGVHDLIVHNYGAGRALASLHAEVPSDSNFVAVHEEIDEAEKRVWQQTGVYLVIHMDPIDVNDEHINALREQVDCVLRGIDEKLSMHDFRVVDGERQINLIFDVVVPFSYDDEGKRRLLMTIYDDLKAIDQRFNPVVTLDHAM